MRARNPTTDVTRSINIPGTVVGYVLGRRGATLANVASTTGCTLWIDESVEGRPIAVVTGGAIGVAAAIARIHSIIDAALSSGPPVAPTFARLIPLPHTDVGAVIGRGGDVIRGIAAATGAAMRVVRRGAGRQFVEISAGDDGACAAAASAVAAVVTAAARTAHGDDGNSAGAAGPHDAYAEAPDTGRVPGGAPAAKHWVPHAVAPHSVRVPQATFGAYWRPLRPASASASASATSSSSLPASSPTDTGATPVSAVPSDPASPIGASTAAGSRCAPDVTAYAGVAGAGADAAPGHDGDVPGLDAGRGAARPGRGGFRDPAIVEAARVSRDAAADAAPLHRTLTLSHPSLLGVVLGRGGRAVQTIARATGTIVTVDKRLGLVVVHGPNLAALDAASRDIDARLVAHFAADGALRTGSSSDGRGGAARPG